MNILHYSTEDVTGGAAKAAYRLHKALRDAGHESLMVVRNKKSDDPFVLQTAPPPPRPWASRVDRVRQRVPGLRRPPLVASYTFNFDVEPPLDPKSLFAAPADEVDIICLHWITGLLDVKMIRRLVDHYRCPVVWVLADIEPITGGCHYSFDCNGYANQCGCCPQLNSDDPQDRSHQLWLRKRELLSALPICFVAQSSWVEQRIRRSSLFAGHRVERIPLAVDARTFRPFDKSVARDLLHLPPDKKIVFFGAHYLTDPRKGMPLLMDALHLLKAQIESESKIAPDDVFLLIAGLNARQALQSTTELPFASKFAGHLDGDVLMALAYQAADIFVCPSVEDAGPMMVAEAMLCGLPVVAFDTGSAHDLIEHRQNGYLAALSDSADLAQGLNALLTAEAPAVMRAVAHRAGLAAHAPAVVVERHLTLYRSLLDACRQAT